VPTQLLATVEPPTARVRLIGAFGFGSDDLIERRLEDLRGLGCTRVEVDGRKVTSINRAAMQTLVGAQARLGDDGCRLTVVAASTTFLRSALAGGFCALVEGAATAAPRGRGAGPAR
jgi:anti-anti-sigma regulatory factor